MVDDPVEDEFFSILMFPINLENQVHVPIDLLNMAYNKEAIDIDHHNMNPKNRTKLNKQFFCF